MSKVMDDYVWGTGKGRKRHLVAASERGKTRKPFEPVPAWCYAPVDYYADGNMLSDDKRVMAKEACLTCERALRRIREYAGELPAGGYEPGYQTDGNYAGQFIVQAAESMFGMHIGWIALPTHEENERCKDGCSVHSPSAHLMRDWPQYWRADRFLMERTCEHGVGHPDPDDIAFKRTIWKDDPADEPYAATAEEKIAAEERHGCDGCCVAP